MDFKDLDEVVYISASHQSSYWSRNIFLEEMTNTISQCFTIKLEERVVGFICFRKIGEESELLNIGVHPEYRRLGFGKELMNFYIEYCRKIEVNRFFLEVCASNQSAIQLYNQFSFKKVGVRKNFYQGKWDALIMEKAI